MNWLAALREYKNTPQRGISLTYDFSNGKFLRVGDHSPRFSNDPELIRNQIRFMCALSETLRNYLANFKGVYGNEIGDLVEVITWRHPSDLKKDSRYPELEKLIYRVIDNEMESQKNLDERELRDLLIDIETGFNC